MAKNVPWEPLWFLVGLSGAGRLVSHVNSMIGDMRVRSRSRGSERTQSSAWHLNDARVEAYVSDR